MVEQVARLSHDGFVTPGAHVAPSRGAETREHGPRCSVLVPKALALGLLGGVELLHEPGEVKVGGDRSHR